MSTASIGIRASKPGPRLPPGIPANVIDYTTGGGGWDWLITTNFPGGYSRSSWYEGGIVTLGPPLNPGGQARLDMRSPIFSAMFPGGTYPVALWCIFEWVSFCNRNGKHVASSGLGPITVPIFNYDNGSSTAQGYASGPISAIPDRFINIQILDNAYQAPNNTVSTLRIVFVGMAF